MNSQPPACSPWPEIVDVSQVVSAGLSLLALVAALYAIVKTNRDLARERRVAHELELIRGLLQVRDQVEWKRYVRNLRAQLLMVPGSMDFPMMRAATEARASKDALVAFAARYPHAPPLHVPECWSKRAAIAASDGVLLDEAVEAIERRLSGRTG